MADVSLEINLQDGEPLLDMRRYRPGDTINGTAVVYPNKEINAQHIYIRLQWQTAGRGTPFKQKEAELDLFQGTLSAGLPQSYPFQFVVPEQPWSYEGHYIKILWEIELSIALSWTRDPQQTQAILVEPERELQTGWSSQYA